jgi:hypothetical protein
VPQLQLTAFGDFLSQLQDMREEFQRSISATSLAIDGIRAFSIGLEDGLRSAFQSVLAGTASFGNAFRGILNAVFDSILSRAAKAAADFIGNLVVGAITTLVTGGAGAGAGAVLASAGSGPGVASAGSSPRINFTPRINVPRSGSSFRQLPRLGTSTSTRSSADPTARAIVTELRALRSELRGRDRGAVRVNRESFVETLGNALTEKERRRALAQGF